MKTCIICRKPYNNSNNRSKTCSRKCFTKHRRDYMHIHQRKDMQHVLKESLRRVITRSKLKGMKCNITFQDLWDLYQEQSERCEMTGEKLQISSGNGLSQRSPWGISIDRIDNSKGYVKGNIQLVSNIYNMCKSTWDHETVVKFCKNLLKQESICPH